MNRHRLTSTRLAQRDAGFTVLEALVSLIVFVVVATSASYGLIKAIDASHGSQQRVDAADIAQYFVAEAIRRAGEIQQSPPEGSTLYSGVGPKIASAQGNKDSESFNVTETINYDTPGSCNVGNLFWVHVVVTQAQTNRFLARSDARVACPRV